MIISKEEFRELGFICDTQNEKLLESCIKRAEYVLNALCRGTLASAMAQSKSNAALIKQAAAFEADALLKAECSPTAEPSSSTTRVALGDLSYTESSGYIKNAKISAIDVPQTVKRLLCAAGCFSGAAAEVIE